MRATLPTFAALTIVSAVLFLGADGNARLVDLPPIPADILGWIAVNDPASNLELLGQARIEELPLETGDLTAPPVQVLAGLQRLSQLGQSRLWILVHGLEQRDHGARKIHLSLLLARSPHLDTRLDHGIQELAEALFQGESTILEDGEMRLLRGASPEQLLYQVRLPELIVVSNSASGWRQVLEAWAGRVPHMADRPAFRQLRRHFDITQGIMVYCDTGQILPFLPGFGYQIRRSLWGVEEEFWPLEPEQEQTHVGTAG